MLSDLKQKLEGLEEALGVSFRFMSNEQSDFSKRYITFQNELREYSKELAVILPYCCPSQKRGIEKIIVHLEKASRLSPQINNPLDRIRSHVSAVSEEFSKIEKTDSKKKSLSIENWKVINIFIASPGDVAYEREIIKRIVVKENDIHFHEQGYHIETISWETDSPPNEEEWQNSLNNLIDTCFLFICVLWTRIGKYTKIEYEYALRHLKEKGYPHILMYFSNVPLVEESKKFRGEQEIRNFRYSLDPVVRHFSYDERRDFEEYSLSLQSIKTFKKSRLILFDELFREHLGKWYYYHKRNETFAKLSTFPIRKKDYSSKDIFRSFNRGDWEK